MLVSELEPREVFQYFSQISSIPHGSGNTGRIAAYCVDFANEQGLKSIRDKYNNVIIYADGTKGYEDSEPVIIQGHLDMVCEKNPDLDIDMDKEAITICTDRKKVWARGTTLGGDDGIAVAYILALLASKDIPHPPLEAVLTSDEETGMFGARGLDMNLLKGRKLINIDSEEEGFVCVSCAGGVRACCRIPCTRIKVDAGEYRGYCVTISGLQGGHSGVDIHKNRENAFVLMGEMLSRLSKSVKLTLSDIKGGGKDNVIPKMSKMVICIPRDEAAILEQEFEAYRRLMLDELALTEPEIKLELDKVDTPAETMSEESTGKIIFTLQHIPNGVERMNPEIEDLTQTSSNLGIINVHPSHITLRTLIRSNTASGKKLLLDKISDFISYVGGDYVTESDYPAWEYRAHSPLRDTMVSEFEKMYGRPPVITAIHAGLECGIFAGKREDLDMVSIGPDMLDVHTPSETMDVESVERTWRYLKNVLAVLR